MAEFVFNPYWNKRICVDDPKELSPLQQEQNRMYELFDSQWVKVSMTTAGELLSKVEELEDYYLQRTNAYYKKSDVDNVNGSYYAAMSQQKNLMMLAFEPILQQRFTMFEGEVIGGNSAPPQAADDITPNQRDAVACMGATMQRFNNVVKLVEKKIAELPAVPIPGHAPTELFLPAGEVEEAYECIDKEMEDLYEEFLCEVGALV